MAKDKDAVEQAQENIKSIQRSKRTINAHEGYRALTQAQIDEVSRKNQCAAASTLWLSGQEYDLARITIQIQESIERISTEFIRIGALLNAVKKVEGYGFFLKWLSENFPMSERTAQYFMFVATKLEQRPELSPFAKGGIKKALALLDLPDEYQTEFIEHDTIQGEGLDKYLSMTQRELYQEVKRISGQLDKVVQEETKGLRKERDTALSERDQAVKRLALLESEERKTIEEVTKDAFDACLLFVRKCRILMEDERIKNLTIIREIFGKIGIVQGVIDDLYQDLGELGKEEDLHLDD